MTVIYNNSSINHSQHSQYYQDRAAVALVAVLAALLAVTSLYVYEYGAVAISITFPTPAFMFDPTPTAIPASLPPCLPAL